MSRAEKKPADLSEYALVMAEDDNVAVAKQGITAGSMLEYRGRTVTVTEDIGAGQRFALTDIGEGKFVSQYGHPFAISKGIAEGQPVSAANIEPYCQEFRGLSGKGAEGRGKKISERGAPACHGKTFKGFERKDGRVGTRNYYLIVPASLCASDLASKLANEFSGRAIKQYGHVSGVVAAAHTEGCGCNDGAILERAMLVLRNTIAHPNVGAALVLELGCEKTNFARISEYLDSFSLDKPVDFLSIQGAGGTRRALEKGKAIIDKRLREMNGMGKKDFPAGKLVVGTECGASDAFSGITANPLIGRTVDMIINAGGSAILSEVPEMIGAEAALLGRTCSGDVAERFIRGLDAYRGLAERLGVKMDGNLVEANAKGGLLTLSLKSLGAILKGGKTEIVDFLDYGETVKRRGLSVMDGPGNDLESMTGLTAAGANIILFSTGLGTTEGSLITPVVKISSRTELYERMDEDMDFDAGRLLNGGGVEGLSRELFEFVLRVASGEKTWSEKWEKRSFQIWTAGKLS